MTSLTLLALLFCVAATSAAQRPESNAVGSARSLGAAEIVNRRVGQQDMELRTQEILRELLQQRCLSHAKPCSTDDDCCSKDCDNKGLFIPNYLCEGSDPPPIKACRGDGGKCKVAGDCCSGNCEKKTNLFSVTYRCKGGEAPIKACLYDGGKCKVAGDCCSGNCEKKTNLFSVTYRCKGGEAPFVCKAIDEKCKSTKDCCTGTCPEPRFMAWTTRCE